MGWVCPVLSPPPPPSLTARPGCALGRCHPRPRRHSGPKPRRDPRLAPLRTRAGGRTRTRQALPRGPPPASTGMPPPASILENRGRTGVAGDTRKGPSGAEDAPAGRLLGPRTHLSFSARALAALRGASSAAGQGHARDVSTQGTHGWVPAEVGGTKREKGLRAARAPPLVAHARGLRSLHAQVGSLRLLTVIFFFYP